MESTPTERILARVLADREHGSLRLTIWSLDCLEAFVKGTRVQSPSDFYVAVEELGRKLATSRPAMASICNAVAYVVYSLKAKMKASSSIEDLKRVAHHSIQIVRNEVEAGPSRIANSFSKEASTHRRFLTLSFSSTVLASLIKVKPITVFVAESRPRLEGVELARNLAESGMKATVVPDFAASGLVEKADALVFGADTVFEDGSIVNKVGSRALAFAAARFEKPLYVLFDRWKLAPGKALAGISEEDTTLIESQEEGYDAFIPIFEVVESTLIPCYISEFGMMDRSEVSKRARELLPIRSTVLS